MLTRKQVQFEALRTLAGGSITGSYAALGVPTIYSARIIAVTNNTDGDVFISTDGTTNMMFVPKTSFRVYDFGSNRFQQDESFYIPAGTQFYVKQSSATSSGALYIELVYGVQSPI